MKIGAIKMAIFRAEVKPISRGKGHNAVAAAAYRSGEELEDTNQFNSERTTHDYSNKSDVLHKNIILTDELTNANFSISRQDLWSKVEEHEVTQRGKKLKQNARVAREWLLALPHEFSDKENIELAEKFAKRLVDDLGVIADCCIHKPSLKTNAPKAQPKGNTADKEVEKEDDRNIHAHIMFTTRKAKLNAASQLVFTDKAECELDGQARAKAGLEKEKDYLREVRAIWADMLNERLKEYGLKEVTHLSYKDQNLNILPTVHEGRNPFTADKKRHNDEVTERNELVFKSRVDTLEKLAALADEDHNVTKRFSEITKRFTGTTDKLAARNSKLSEHTAKRTEYSKRQLENCELAASEANRLIESKPSRPITVTVTDPKLVRRAIVSSERTIAAAEFATYDAEFSTQEYRRRFDLVQKNKILHLAANFARRTEKMNCVLYSHEEKESDPAFDRKFDRRQISALDDFATQTGLVRDRDNDEMQHDFISRVADFFSDKENRDKHREIFEMIKEPGTDKRRHAETLLNASRATLDSKLHTDSSDLLKTSQRAENSLSNTDNSSYESPSP